MTQLILYASSKYTDKIFVLRINNQPDTELVTLVINEFINEIWKYKTIRDPSINTADYLREFIASCFGNEDIWSITNSNGKILKFGENDSHTFITPHKTKQFPVKLFLNKVFKKEVKPMAVKIVHNKERAR